MDAEKIFFAMEQSALAYHEVQPYRPGVELTIIDDRETGVQCFLRRRDDHLYITFRGSDSRQDWRTNLTFWQKTVPYGNTSSKIRVHTGFIRAYKHPNVRDAIQARITDEVHFIHIAGHSYGAAMAVLCAVDLEYNFPDRNYEAFLFGCPRVGNRAFQRSYNRRVYNTVRVENGNDIVTKIPFELWDYHHVGAEMHVGHLRILGWFSFADHYPTAYYSALLRFLLN